MSCSLDLNFSAPNFSYAYARMCVCVCACARVRAFSNPSHTNNFWSSSYNACTLGPHASQGQRADISSFLLHLDMEQSWTPGSTDSPCWSRLPHEERNLVPVREERVLRPPWPYTHYHVQLSTSV